MKLHQSQRSHVQTLVQVDVYCFGHVLYEMATGTPLPTAKLPAPLACPACTWHCAKLILIVSVHMLMLSIFACCMMHITRSWAVSTQMT